MIYPKNIFHKLGLDQLLDLSRQRCETQRGKALVDAIQFSSDPELVKRRLLQTHEMLQILEEGSLNVLLPIDLELNERMASQAGFFYEEDVLVQIMDLLRAIDKVLTFFQERDDYPELEALFQGIAIAPDLSEILERSLDEEGKLRPSASNKLRGLHSEIGKLERKVNSQSQTLFQQHKAQGVLAETEMTIKDGRLVFPVRSEHKRKVEGLLIDQSASGKISYIEPLHLVRLNNELSEARILYRQEVVQVLRDLSRKIFPELGSMNRMIHQLAAFDLIRAKARLALDYNWRMPEVNRKETVMNRAVHPLLQIKLKAENSVPVAMDLSLNENQRLVVISGPNAGGKSVALKTVGLLHLMVQTGFLVPVDEGSTFRVFEHVFVDIGDDQSIESDLSTYTSHLKAAKHIVNFCDENSLVLVDEIGTGTDPMFGGPMAQAIVEEIHDRGASGVITTHFSNIKTTAKRLEGAVNAAMIFDTEELRPLYQLTTGQAGSSFSFEVARNIGLNRSLIKKARSYADTRQYDLDLLLAEVQQQKEQLRSELSDLKTSKSEAERFEKEYRELKAQLELQQSQLIKQAKQEASEIIAKSNKEVERTIRQIKESQADQQKTRKVRKGLEKMKEELLEVEKPKQDVVLKVGDRVLIKGTQSVGEILSLDKKNVEVSIGSVKTRTKLSNIEKVGAAQEKKMRKYISRSSFQARQENFNSTLDVRGMRTDEAIKELDRWLDSAVMLGFIQLKLIHGKGQGILRQQLRGYLKNHPSIASLAYEPENQGGQGVSLIALKE